MVEPDPATVLELELRRRHWSREHALAEMARTAREMGVRGYTLSLRQLDRWLSAQVHIPRGPACQVAERLFGLSIETLLGPVASLAPATAVDEPPTEATATLTLRAAAQARRHARAAAASVVDAVSVEALHLEVRRLARGYASTAPQTLLADLVDTRDGAYQLLRLTRRPSDLAELYLIAGQVCGLAATTSWDLGDTAAADDLAAAAWTYAQLCNHATLRAWVRSVQATIAFWSHRPAEGLRVAEDGLRYAAGASEVRLHAITARAWTMLPRGSDRALAALRRAFDAREHSRDTDELADSTGGEFAFPPARLALCAGAVHLGLGNGAQAARHSAEALHLYRQTPAPQRRWAVHHGALIDLATARAQQGDLDGACDALEPALQLEPARRTARLTGRLQTFGRVVADSPHRHARLSQQLTGAVKDWIASALINAPIAALATAPTTPAPAPGPSRASTLDPW
ncbi:hypothetical protein [Couchioplanes azureus]|uniref:hypothetical protein n=1 Tax=Couchioplanes caeruleus TaxID=56438 RepID=UPI00166FA9B1|nr:hypothetical protein [Couchioplanes caeruleus]GGQ83718.1 hypothetical protein GCM10010166_62370 [Couchioplanes caeruleus subsp. azureus]